MRNPDMIVARGQRGALTSTTMPIENQWLAEMTGGADKTKVLGLALNQVERELGLPETKRRESEEGPPS